MKLSSRSTEREAKAASFRLSDGHGLSLQIEPTGSKLWRFRYRFAGKANMLSLGSFPDVSLAAAREKRDEARRLLAAGENPSQARKTARRAAESANTFGVIAEE
ncbi:Arm DNA-binding domain-containing protein [Rhodopseudomonas palustris]|uniref:Arm DNA-binding domain-containing protein n=1 Tax=Rhodopseudomonas palustris TaxID=1076 RepID=UPI0022F0708F|nr:Arm DNA-binding domain-containing protein [Rhodopseudomonas palustris]WBU29622.1 Arm DNA-binding domain-containing protein [Rhodopseudomonas palustris]